jgi:hypothetical protein
MWFRLLSFLFLAGCIWVGVELYTEGSDRAFGGVLSGFGPGTSSRTTTPLERIQGAAAGSRDRQLGRIERQLEDASVGLEDRAAHERRED